MKYKKNIGFAIIYRNKPILNSLVNVFTKAYKINKRFFGKDVKSFRIFVCDNESDFKKQMKYYYKKRTTASVMRNNDLITRSPEFIGKVGRWDKKLFPKIMVHEINHVFWNSFYRTCKPCWLLEGLACYVAGFRKLSKKQLKNLVNKYKIDYSILDYRYLKRKFKISPQIVKYPIWYRNMYEHNKPIDP